VSDAVRAAGAPAAGAAGEAPAALLACRGITVRFGGLVAVDDVTLEVPPAVVVGLVGPNGAGKSTLFSVASGLLRPTGGHVWLGGFDITRASPQRRAELGLARTFQHPELFAGLTVREHLVLAWRARHQRSRVWSDLLSAASLRPPSREEAEAVDELVGLLGLGGVAHQPAMGLPLGVSRLVELGRALARQPRVLLLDEPSSGLDSGETDQFEATLSRLARERQIAVLLVEHDVDLVMRMCSTVHVLDFGRLIASGPPSQVRSDPAVRAAYLGEAVSEDPSAPPQLDRPDPAGAARVASQLRPPARGDSEAAPGEKGRRGDSAGGIAPSGGAGGIAPSGGAGGTGPARVLGAVLSVDGLSVRYGDALALSEVSFALPPGRVLAVLGPNGAGKSSLARAVSGLVRPAGGQVVLDGSNVGSWSAQRIRRAGLIHLPEGRGVFRSLSVQDNLRMAAGVLVGRAARREALDRAYELFPALADRRRQVAGSLSGGEQQMLSLARALATSPKVLVADEMSLGLAPLMVDLVFEGLRRARNAGVAVVMIEQYVHRALDFADDCLLLNRGRVAWAGPSAEAGSRVLGQYLGSALATGA
jgi:branched-chain amino acid transport system ATP-binding protein